MATPHLADSDSDHYVFSRLVEFELALEEEIAKLREGGGQKTYLSDGRYLGMRDGRAVYSFTADSELRFPDDTGVDLEYQHSRYSGVIASIAGVDIVIALSDYIGDAVATAILFTEPWFLLHQLTARLSTMRRGAGANIELAAWLLGHRTPSYKPNVRQSEAMLALARRHRGSSFTSNTDQMRAVGHVLANPVSFIWGPPGTGKTSTLGMTVAALVERGETVLVLAHSNVAVDVAMASIAAQLGYSDEYQQGRVLRFGPAALRALDTFPQLHVRGVVRQQNPKLISEIEALERQRRQLVNRSRAEGLSATEGQRIKDEIARTKETLAPLHDQLKLKETELVRSATVVGCTLSKASIAPEVFERSFDAVVVDEASMAYIPHCVFVAGLARQRTAIFGDFRQLAPIAQAETERVQRWLQRDIFAEAGITERVNEELTDPRMVMLTTQHRMHPKIAAVVNHLFYGGRLRNGPDVKDRAAPAVAALPVSGHPLVFYDLKHLGAHCFSDKESHSRFNPVSALIAVQLARQVLASAEVKEVGIVTPYSAQSRLIRRILKDVNLPDERVRVATVHRFQGSENLAIVFDAVDGEPQSKPGKLLQGGMDSTAMRLANVALSRAQGKFIGLFDRAYLNNHLGSTDIFLAFMRDLADRSRVQSLQWPYRPGASLFNEELTGLDIYRGRQPAFTRIERDFLAAHEEIAIYWPVPLSDAHSSFRVLLQCDSSKVRFYINGAGAKTFPTQLRNAQIMDTRSTLGIGLIGIDRKQLWLALDPSSERGVYLRLDLPQTTSLLYSLWRLVPETDLAPGKILQMSCQRCEQPMWVTTGKYGAYLKCQGCGFTRNITPPIATELARISGVTCRYCGAMVKGRKSSYGGVFLGCTRYPDCSWRMPLEDLV